MGEIFFPNRENLPPPAMPGASVKILDLFGP